MIVREYDRDSDFDGIRAFLIELQGFERRIDLQRPTGVEISNECISDALSKCAEGRGRIFVADAHLCAPPMDRTQAQPPFAQEDSTILS